MAAMNKIEAVDRLNAYADAIKARGATGLYLFGSTVRDEAGPDSDLDLFIDYDHNSKFNLLDLVDIKLLLEDELKMRIDVTTRDGLHPMLRQEIEQSAVRVF
jgi:predicted nucleotidyltransferase